MIQIATWLISDIKTSVWNCYASGKEHGFVSCGGSSQMYCGMNLELLTTLSSQTKL